MLTIIVVVVLILLLVGLLPTWGYSRGRGWGYFPSGILILILVLVLVLWAIGALPTFA